MSCSLSLSRSDTRTIDLLISEEEFEARRKKFVPPPLRATKGTLFKYIQHVSTASEGCVTDELRGNEASDDMWKGKMTPAVATMQAKIEELEAKLAAK